MASDAAFLVGMVALAADWREGSDVRSAADVLAEPSLAHYAAGWPMAGDAGCVAEMADGTLIGAAWWRLFPSEDPGYGFVDAAVPEVAVAVVPEHRVEGVGSALMQQLIELAVEEALPGLSLSVERDNEALSIYQGLGFVEVGGSTTAATMLLRLGDA